MKDFLKTPSEVHSHEERKPLSVKKATYPLRVTPLNVSLGYTCKSIQ
jgi:hypothetical protein